NGVGIEADPEKAANLYEQAAEAGFAPAGFHLSQMYREGKGVPWTAQRSSSGHSRRQKLDTSRHSTTSVHCTGTVTA
ncbi:MAG: sel1 repeat family protein, partial [Butyricicoccus pullicaecorum]|nr:sel1 repeat family protein [Butyricicoccus pullicaecorum]